MLVNPTDSTYPKSAPELIGGCGVNHIEFQSFIIVFFKIGMKYETLLSISQKNMRTPKYQLQFHSSNICIFAPNVFGFTGIRMW